MSIYAINHCVSAAVGKKQQCPEKQPRGLCKDSWAGFGTTCRPFYFWAKRSNTKPHFTTLSKGGAYKLNKKENALMRELNGKYSVGNLTSGDQFAFLMYLANNWKALGYKGTIKNIHQIPMSLSYICRLKKKKRSKFPSFTCQQDKYSFYFRFRF